MNRVFGDLGDLLIRGLIDEGGLHCCESQAAVS